MNTQLNDLMQRATENLEPVSPDLLERSVQHGLRLRRRRSTILGLAGTGAVLATAGLVAGGIQWFGNPSDASVAGTSTPSVVPINTSPAKPAHVDPHQALKTLRLLLDAPGRTFTKPETWGGAKEGFAAAAYLVDDGKGAARVDVLLSGGGEENPCATSSTGCTKLADGSSLFAVTEQPAYSDQRQDKDGVVSNYVALYLRDGGMISLTSYNGPEEKGSPHTRQKPLLSVADLTKLVESKAWKIPPAAAKPTNKVAVKPSSKLHPTK
jgi:hypothetical protein